MKISIGIKRRAIMRYWKIITLYLWFSCRSTILFIATWHFINVIFKYVSIIDLNSINVPSWPALPRVSYPSLRHDVGTYPASPNIGSEIRICDFFVPGWLNKLLNKYSMHWWFETPRCSNCYPKVYKEAPIDFFSEIIVTIGNLKQSHCISTAP